MKNPIRYRRVLASPVDEAHVVDEDQRAHLRAFGGHRIRRHMQRSRRVFAYDVRIGPGAGACLAAELGRIRRRLVGDLALAVAVRDRVEPFVLKVACEQLPDRAAVAGEHELAQPLLHRVGHEPRPDLEVVDPPPEHQRVDERHQCQRQQRKHDGQRRDESKGEPQPPESGPDAHRGEAR